MERSSSSNAEKELIDLNIKIGEAEKCRNKHFLKRILADDLIFRRANGKVVNKRKYLADLVKPGNTMNILFLRM
jgi:hypothetical protein